MLKLCKQSITNVKLKEYNDDLKPLEVIRFALSVTIVIWHFQNFFYPVSSENWILIRERQPFYQVFKWCYDNGLIAVQYFWFISGIIFFRIYADDIYNRRISWLKFLYNRFSRLYPLHFMTLLLVLILQIAYFSRNGIYFMNPISSIEFFKHLLFIHSWNKQNFSFNGPSWSVSVEIIIYFLFFFFAISGFFRKISFTLITIIVVVLLKRLNIVFYSDIVNCLYFFMIGGFLITYYDFVNTKQRQLMLISFILLGYILLDYFRILEMDILWNLSVKTIFMSFFIVFPAIFIFRRINFLRNISYKKFTLLGNLTYSTYLLHFPIQIFFVTFFIDSKSEVLFSRAFFLLYLSIVLFTSIFVYYFFEKTSKAFLRKWQV